jgi:hypothetical protein
MDNYLTILPTSCINFNHTVKKFCLPEKTACDNTVIDGLFTECGNQWNCNKLCHLDHDYFTLLPDDGKIMMQFNFNTPKNPTQGWGSIINIEMYDSNNTLISSDHTDFASRWMVGHSGKYGFQNIEIDGSKISQDCFYFKITYGDVEICTHHFKKVECDNVVELESYHKDYDCWNNYYKPSSFGFNGSANFSYSNKIYLSGSYKYYGNNISDGIVTETVRFYPSELMAPYIVKYLSNKILNAKYVIIDGQEYKNKANTINAREKSSMFFPILEFERTSCDSKSSSCN